MDDEWRMDLSAIDPADADRALMLWVNTPGNPAGGLDDLEAVAAWGLAQDVAVFSDECYVEFTWHGPPRTVLGHGGGPDGLDGVVAVHSLSKRSNMAGMRVGWYAGDRELVGYLREVRKHAGFMVPGPVQQAGAVALGDQDHVVRPTPPVPRSPGASPGDPRRFGGGRAAARRRLLPVGAGPGRRRLGVDDLAGREGGVLVSPGSFYGPGGAGYVRIAMVAPLERLDLVARRLGVVGPARQLVPRPPRRQIDTRSEVDGGGRITSAGGGPGRTFG